MNAMMALLVLSGLCVGGLLGKAGPGAAVGDAFPAAAELKGVAVVTAVYMMMWYIFLGNQVGIKFTQGLAPEVADQAKLIADRTVINTMEQAFPFLSLLWLHAIFVNPETARLLGWIYVLFRYTYPIFFGMYGQFNTAVEVACQPNYAVVFYFLFAVLYKCLSGEDFHKKVDDVSPWLMSLVGLMCSFFMVLFYLVLSIPSTKTIINGVKKDKETVADQDYAEE